MGVRPKKCKNPDCGKMFTPKRSTLEAACSLQCAIVVSRLRQEKKERQELRKRREALKTHKDYVQDLQKVFNKYIRERDKNKGCISCSEPLWQKDKFDAGHFYSAGLYPNLRFHEDNVHGQCVHCNQHKHGNIVEYTVRLPYRIGDERFNNLRNMAQQSNKLSIPELKALIIKYKEKYKLLKNGTRK